MPSGYFCGCLEWGNAKVGAPYGGVVGNSDPMIEAGVPSTE